MQRKISPKREKTCVQGDNGPSGNRAHGGSVLIVSQDHCACRVSRMQGLGSALGVNKQSRQSHDSALTTCSSLLESPASSTRKKRCLKNPKPAQCVERCGFHHRRGKASSPGRALSLRSHPPSSCTADAEEPPWVTSQRAVTAGGDRKSTRLNSSH